MFNESIREKIKSQAALIEEKRTLPDELLEIAYDEKLFKLFVPTYLGGRMLELPEAIRLFQEASAIEGSFGWLVTIGSGGNMFVPHFKEETCQQLFSPKEAVIAGSGHPTAIARKTEGGYYVSGEWKYCSGAPYASMFTANSKLENTEEIITCIFKPSQVNILEDWDAFGLKGTGSHSIQVENVFVPDERTFDLAKQANDFGEFVHTFPFVQFSQATFSGVCLGLGQSFFEEASHLIQLKKERWLNFDTSKYDKVNRLLNEELNQFKQKEREFYTALDLLWTKHTNKEILNEEELQNFSNQCKELAVVTIESSNELIRHFGMEAVMETSQLNRIWRNLYTASQHTFLAP